MSSALPQVFKNSDKDTFGYYTAHTRWPIIVTNAIDDVEKELQENSTRKDYLQQGATIKQQLVDLRNEIQTDQSLRLFSDQESSVAGVPASFNEELQRNPTTWLTAGWLFAEVYLYRRINVFFRSQPLWSSYDVFNRLKQETFESSLHGVVELAIRYKNLHSQLQSADQETLQILFKEFIEISLWGNATDLSLLTNATLEDIRSIQGAQARKDSESKILVNDTLTAWDSLSPKGNRIDFVLDNSGFELYADLMLALFLLDTGVADKCIFHAKDIPYMVSDVMLKDFDLLLQDLKSRDFFPVKDLENPQLADESLNALASTIESYVSQGKIQFVEDSFWTTDLDYWHLDPSETKYHGSVLHKDLVNSDLVIFKGDLNYRKLTGDRHWPRTTPWNKAIGPLASNKIKSLSLRTAKADVIVDLPEGVDEQLCKLWEEQGNDVGSFWSSSGKWAVICYSTGNNWEM